METIKIVMIDDDSDDFFLVKDLLVQSQHQINYEIQWIPSSDEGIDAIRKQNADVYLIDYNLDKKSGLDVLDTLEGSKDIKPIIFLTGQADLNIDLAAMQKGAADFIVKKNLTRDLLERAIRYSIKRTKDQIQINEAVQLKAAKEFAELANQAKTQFLAVVSHEMRTPLTAISGFADLSLDPDCTEHERIKYAGIIKKNAHLLLELLNETLDTAKVESGQIDIQLNQFDWWNTVQEILQLLKPKADAKKINIEAWKDPQLPGLLYSDARRFRQILTNLIANAVKFTEQGRIDIECDHRVNRNGHDDLIISVQDTGIGIAAEEQKRLFHPFQQANSNVGLKYGGTGLGLDISKKLASALGGDLMLTYSKPGVGSLFTWILKEPFLKAEIAKASQSITLSQ